MERDLETLVDGPFRLPANAAAKLVAEDKATVHDESYWWMTYVADL